MLTGLVETYDTRYMTKHLTREKAHIRNMCQQSIDGVQRRSRNREYSGYYHEKSHMQVAATCGPPCQIERALDIEDQGYWIDKIGAD